MPVNHAAVAAIPQIGAPDKSLLRGLTVARMPYVLADTDVPTDLVAVDSWSGAAIIDILYLGRVFHYDPTDSVTANDGTSCLVSFEGRRYKLAQGTDVFAYAVLDNTHTAPPGSPAIGDSYLVATAATGAWVGRDNQVAVYTRRGWEFVNFGIGRFIYVEATDSYYHKNAVGAWIAGFGTQTLGANAVPITSVIAANASFVIKVENQTTNAPPVAVQGTSYVIGPSPTGVWAGNAGKLAMALVNGTWTIITPVAGDQVYDKSLQVPYNFNGTAWTPGGGSWVGFKSTGLTVSGTTTAPSGSTIYSWSSSSAPTTSQRRLIDGVTLSYAAKRAGATLRFHYSADFDYFASATPKVAIALFRDSVANAIDWHVVPYLETLGSLAPSPPINISVHADYFFEVAAPDTSSHTYTIAIMSQNAVSSDPSNLVRRILEVEESA